jgi:cytochrome c556
MPGMFTGDRMVRLEVAGVCQPSAQPTNQYVLTVPFSSMSKAMQNVSRMGGKIVGVQVSDVKAVAAAAATVATVVDKTPGQKKGKKK